ncbi:spore germination protein GerPC [Paenibacillus sp. HJGM_3]|uniref:spore germination protein GerPC n=1 Tax=Paenibacillus sp. HJGM_3 TaxID=3379816 RepID=UPI00385E670B
MNSGYDWNMIFRQLYTQLLWQSEKLGKMDRKLDAILAELQAIRGQKPVNVEKIEYNFDQLKVEKLDGTLNIGITPDNAKSIEQLALGDSEVMVGPVPIQTQSPQSFAAIQNGVMNYLNAEAPEELMQMEGKYNLSLPGEYRAHILADVQKQVNARIVHYMQQMELRDDGENPEERVREISEQVKADIRKGVEQYLQTFPKREEE